MTAITLRLDDATYERLRVEAFEKRTTISALIRAAIDSLGVSADLIRAEAITEMAEGYRSPIPGYDNYTVSEIMGELDARAAEYRKAAEHPAHSGHEYGGAYARAGALAAGDPDWMNATGGRPETSDAEEADHD